MTNVEQPSVTFRPAAFLGGKPGSRAGHLPFEYDLVAALKPGLIVELGVYFGDTYFGLCQAVAENNISSSCYAVDTWLGDAETGLYDKTVYSAVEKYNDKRYRSFSYLVRKTFEEALPEFSNESIELLHIDGLHTYEASKTDFETWLPKVKPGGVVLLSDVSLRGSGFGTWKFWEELQLNYQTFVFRNNNGLGVLKKPGGEGSSPFLRELLSASNTEQERIRRYYVLCAERLDFAEKAGASGAADSRHSVFEVYTSRAGKYETSDDLRTILEPGNWTNVSLRFPAGTGDGPLRISPANRTAVVEIANIALRKPDGQLAWSWTPKDPMDGLDVKGTAAVLPRGEFLNVLIYGSDAEIYLPVLSAATSTSGVQLEMRVRVDPELSAVRELTKSWTALRIEKLESERKKQQEISQLESRLTQAKSGFEADTAKHKDDIEKHVAALSQDHQTKIRELTEDAERRLAAMRDEFENEKVQMALAFEEERKHHQSILAEKERLTALHPMLAQEASIARGNVGELQAEIERLTTLQTQLELDLVDLRKLNARMAAALDQERHARSTMEESSSWQLTKPLRAVTDIFGPRRR
jgi:hypothetical protein